MRPVCVQCGKEMQCEKNGVIVYHEYERPEPGPVVDHIGGVNVINTNRLIDPMHYVVPRVDFVIYGDMYKCPVCGHEVVTGFAQNAMNDYKWKQEDLREMVDKAGRYAVQITRR